MRGRAQSRRDSISVPAFSQPFSSIPHEPAIVGFKSPASVPASSWHECCLLVATEKFPLSPPRLPPGGRAPGGRMPALDVLALLPRLYGLNPRLAAHVLRLWTLEALLRAKLLPAPAAGAAGAALASLAMQSCGGTSEAAADRMHRVLTHER